jgi:hypothetical protein
MRPQTQESVTNQRLGRADMRLGQRLVRRQRTKSRVRSPKARATASFSSSSRLQVA